MGTEQKLWAQDNEGMVSAIKWLRIAGERTAIVLNDILDNKAQRLLLFKQIKWE